MNLPLIAFPPIVDTSSGDIIREFFNPALGVILLPVLTVSTWRYKVRALLCDGVVDDGEGEKIER